MRNFHGVVYFLGLIMVTVIIACGGEAPSGQEGLVQLAALKEQRSGLEKEIAALETQLEAEGIIEKRYRRVGLNELKPSTFQHFIDLQGKVVADESVAATSRIPGALQKVYINNGDRVKKGQLLAEIDNAMLLKNRAELEGRLALAKDLYIRQKTLWDQNIGSEVQYIQAKNNMESMERAIATLEENMAMTKIYAPTSGTVDMVLLKQGQAISPGMPLCNILNLDDLKVVGSVTEAYASKVKKGDQVKVFFPDMDKEVMTKVDYVSKQINPANRTFLIECKLSKGEYWANQIAVMKIVDYENKSAISIPVNLIQTDEKGNYVLVGEKSDKEGHAVVAKRMITQGSIYNGYVEVVSGLEAGDQIISTGFQDVNPGETVSI